MAERRPGGRFGPRCVGALAAAATARGLYPADHPRCRGAAGALLDLLEDAFADGLHEVTLLVVEGDLVVDGEALRGTTLHGHGLVRALGRHSIERLTLRAGLTGGELSALLATLAGEAAPQASEHVVLGRVLASGAGGAGGEAAAAVRSGGAGGAGAGGAAGGAGGATTGGATIGGATTGGATAGGGGGGGRGGGGGGGAAGRLGEPEVEALHGGLDLLRSDLLSGFARLDRQLWQIVEATARESRPLVVLGEMRSVDERLHRHSVTVSLWTLALARALGFPEGSLHDLALAGLLHDVGLLELPRELVFGRGPRGDAERALLRRHPRLGAVRLCQIPDVGAVPIIVAHEHHLRHDGRGGYPSLGRRPHLAARLVAVVDTWDMLHAATAGYAPTQRHGWVLQALRSRSGTWLDPELVERFVELLGETGAGAG